MRVAVTVWEDRISPVFDASRRLWIAEMENGQITRQSNLIFDPEHPADLANTLDQLEVPVLIGGAISQVPANTITARGITLISFITGDVNHVLKAYAKGQSLSPRLRDAGMQRHRNLNGFTGAKKPKGWMNHSTMRRRL